MTKLAFFPKERIETLAMQGCPKCGNKDHLILDSDEQVICHVDWNENSNEVQYSRWDSIQTVHHNTIECTNCEWSEEPPTIQEDGGDPTE